MKNYDYYCYFEHYLNDILTTALTSAAAAFARPNWLRTNLRAKMHGILCKMVILLIPWSECTQTGFCCECNLPSSVRCSPSPMQWLLRIVSPKMTFATEMDTFLRMISHLYNLHENRNDGSRMSNKQNAKHLKFNNLQALFSLSLPTRSVHYVRTVHDRADQNPKLMTFPFKNSTIEFLCKGLS